MGEVVCAGRHAAVAQYLATHRRQPTLGFLVLASGEQRPPLHAQANHSPSSSAPQSDPESGIAGSGGVSIGTAAASAAASATSAAAAGRVAGARSRWQAASVAGVKAAFTEAVGGDGDGPVSGL
jgi:hypothetical protein